MLTLATRLIGFLAALFTIAAEAPAQSLLIENVTLVDVETGTLRPGQAVLVESDSIARIGPAETLRATNAAQRVDGSGKFLIPGLWDMHVHSHRERRFEYHYPLFRAFGVTGVRDAGSHLFSALAARERARTDPLAPRVVWGSPIIDGAPPFNDFGLSAEDAESGRLLAREMKRYGFDFLKVYDRLTPEAYRAMTQEALRLGLRVEGHVPLSLSPGAVIDAGQTLVDHLTMVVESCIPGEVERANAAQRDHPRETDSLDMLMDDKLAAVLPRYDAKACAALFGRFARAGVWQVPTLIQTRGFFFADDKTVTSDPRIAFLPPGVLRDWRAWTAEAEPAKLANGRKVLALQMTMVRAMQAAGVGLMTGTDASNEPWVFAGSSVHDEMALFVEAGLTPAQALRAATLNPRTYLGRKTGTPLLGPGEAADLVLLDADPLRDIGNSRRISAVIARGRLYDRAALDSLLDSAKAAAARGLP